MHIHPRPATNRPPLSFLLLLALLLPLLAACGGGAAGTAEPVFSNINSGLTPGGGAPLPPAEATRGGVAAAPTAAPAATPFVDDDRRAWPSSD